MYCSIRRLAYRHLFKRLTARWRHKPARFISGSATGVAIGRVIAEPGQPPDALAVLERASRLEQGKLQADDGVSLAEMGSCSTSQSRAARRRASSLVWASVTTVPRPCHAGWPVTKTAARPVL